jgi:Ca2+-transporting ATPase
MRGRAASILSNDVVRNPWVWSALGLCIALVLAAVYLPGLNAALETVALSPMQWLLVLGCSFAPVVVVWIERTVGRLIGH